MPRREIISTDACARSSSPLSQATRFGDLVFVSGMPPVDPASGKIVQGGFAAEMRQSMRNVEAALVAAGSSLADVLRLRAFPFQDEVAGFIARYDQVFVVEQNRDGQMRMLLVHECGVDPAKLIPILHYDGTPITARFIIREIAGRLAALDVAPFRRGIA